MCLGALCRVVSIVDPESHLGVVEVGGARLVVSLLCVVDGPDGLADLVGTWVLVHAGVAIARIDEAEARRTLDLLEGGAP